MSDSSRENTSMSEMSIKQFIEELGSSSPAPGGGGASALAGALGVALTSMVYNLTVGKKVYENLDESLQRELDNNLDECKRLCYEMLSYIDKDKKAFLALMDSYKMPKDTDEEKETRRSTIKECTLNAMNIPLQLANLAVDFYKNIYFAAKYGNKNLISDAAVSAIMLSACIESSIINVEVNLACIDDEVKVKDIRGQIEQIRVINSKFKNDILEFSNKNINK